jgi:hypothetical protein
LTPVSPASVPHWGGTSVLFVGCPSYELNRSCSSQKGSMAVLKPKGGKTGRV